MTRRGRPSPRSLSRTFPESSSFLPGDVLAYNYKAFFGTALPFPSVADPVYLAVYPLTTAGLLLLIRHRNPGRDWASLVDSMIVTIGLALAAASSSDRGTPSPPWDGKQTT